jgi:hypothetical protein
MNIVSSDAQRLEGSRFVALQLNRFAAGGSRERFDVQQFYKLLYPEQNGCDGPNIALSHFLEPPASNR